MNQLRSAALIGSFIGLASTLSACGSGPLGPQEMTQNAAPGRVSWRNGTLAVHADRSRSWMAPDAKKNDLLYVADNGTNDVYVYSYPRGKLMGTLTGFNTPGGLCTDRAGDVFVTNVFDWDVLEYAHGGTSPIETLSQDPETYPDGCAVDPKTGNLAVIDSASGGELNVDPNSVGPGQVVIYRHAQGTPKFYKAIYFPYNAGYDNAGNLFVDGEGAGFSPFEFSELRKGKNTFTPIALNQSFELAGGVQWDGTHIAVGDVRDSAIYEFAINGAVGTETGTTPLTGTYDVWEFWIQGGKVVVPSSEVISSQDLSSVLLYDYPAGGAAARTVTGPFVYPVGVTVSGVPK